MSEDFIVNIHMMLAIQLFVFSFGFVALAAFAARQRDWRSLLNKQDIIKTVLLTLATYVVIMFCVSVLCLLNQFSKAHQPIKTQLHEQHVPPPVPVCDRIS